MGLSVVTMRHPSTCLLAMCVIIILWVSGWLNQASSPSSGSCVSTVDDTDTLRMTVIGCHLEIQRLQKLIHIFCWIRKQSAFSVSLNCWRKHKVEEELCVSIRDCYALLWISSVGFWYWFSCWVPSSHLQQHAQCKSVIKSLSLKCNQSNVLTLQFTVWFKWNEVWNMDDKSTALALCASDFVECSLSWWYELFHYYG